LYDHVMRPFPGVAVAALTLAASGAVVWSQAAPQFRSGVDLVRLPVVVTAKDGLIVRGLTAPDFVVTEDGVGQQIAAFSEGAPGEVVPMHAGLLLDVSESMEMDLKGAVNAVCQFISAFDEAVDVTFLDFDSSIRLTRFSRDGYPRLFERIRAL